MDIYAQQALREYNSAATAAHPGGVNGRPFWNAHSSQFTFVPSFQFANLPEGQVYRFTVKDTNEKQHTFEAANSTASLEPVWKDIPTGHTKLTVEALDESGNLIGEPAERSFFKCDPFPGREALPPKARSYRKSSLEAFRFVYEDPMVQYWLEHGVPQPDYPHNVYPSKTISALINAMVYYAKLEPSRAENAINIAKRAADYLLSITPKEGEPLAFLPPTYSFKGLDAEAVNKVAPAARECQETTMMIYPLSAAMGFLTLEEATGDQKYFEAAMRIANYYKETVLPCGSWYLLFDCNTGKNLTENICVDFNFVTFFKQLYKKTGDPVWRELEVNVYHYIADVCLKTYNWEGQFEDIKVTNNYQNLTHFTANAMIHYIADSLSDDKDMVNEAIDLMRFVEDQFVVWGKYPDIPVEPDDPQAIRHSPAGLEQYHCYGPIDSSTVEIMSAFLDMYQLTDDRLYLEKAMALGDAVTRMQNPETGMSPTFWIGENCSEGYRNFWINCQIHTAFCMQRLADLTEAMEIA